MKQKKGQVSVEFLMVTGLIMMIIMGSLTILMHYAESSTDEFIKNRVTEIGTSMTKNADLLGVHGYPAKKLIYFNFPPRIINMSIMGNHYLVFQVQNRNGLIYPFTFYSTYNISGDFKPMDYVEGRRSFMLKANNEEVNISRWP